MVLDNPDLEQSLPEIVGLYNAGLIRDTRSQPIAGLERRQSGRGKSRRLAPLWLGRLLGQQALRAGVGCHTGARSVICIPDVKKRPRAKRPGVSFTWVQAICCHH